MAKWTFWTQEECNIIKEIYPTKGAKGCLEFIKSRTDDAIMWKAAKLGILKLGRSPINEPVEIKTQKIINILDPKTPEAVYLLGFLWGDGSIGKYQYGNNSPMFKITCSILKEDFACIANYFIIF